MLSSLRVIQDLTQFTNSKLIFLSHRKCGSPKKQNLTAIGRALGAAGSATSSEKSQHLVVPSRSYAFEVTGDVICPGFVQGIDHLRDPRLNKVTDMPNE